jgi:hypothetical protein
MVLTDSTPRYALKARLAGTKWPWLHSAGFIFLSCGPFWVAVIALAWRYL